MCQAEVAALTADRSEDASGVLGEAVADHGHGQALGAEEFYDSADADLRTEAATCRRSDGHAGLDREAPPGRHGEGVHHRDRRVLDGPGRVLRERARDEDAAVGCRIDLTGGDDEGIGLRHHGPTDPVLGVGAQPVETARREAGEDRRERPIAWSGVDELVGLHDVPGLAISGVRSDRRGCSAVRSGGDP